MSTTILKVIVTPLIIMVLGITINRFLDRRKERITAPIQVPVISPIIDWVKDKWYDQKWKKYWKAFDETTNGYWQTHDSITLEQMDPELAQDFDSPYQPVISLSRF